MHLARIAAFALGWICACATPALPRSDFPEFFFATPLAGRSCASSDACTYYCFARDQRLAIGSPAEGICDLAGHGERKVVEGGTIARIVILR